MEAYSAMRSSLGRLPSLRHNPLWLAPGSACYYTPSRCPLLYPLTRSSAPPSRQRASEEAPRAGGGRTKRPCAANVAGGLLAGNKRSSRQTARKRRLRPGTNRPRWMIVSKLKEQRRSHPVRPLTPRPADLGIFSFRASQGEPGRALRVGHLGRCSDEDRSESDGD